MMFPMVILAGGKGTRLYPITKTIPKSLFMFENKPFIYHQLELLEINGFTKVHLCLGEMYEKIIDEITKKKWHIDIKYSVDKPLLGTGGAINKVKDTLGSFFFVMYGDSYLPIDYYAVQKRYLLKNHSSAMMVIYRNCNDYVPSNVEYKDGKIVNYNKNRPTKKMKYIDYGLGIFTKTSFSKFKFRRKFDLSLVYKKALKFNNIKQSDWICLDSYVANDRFYEIGSEQGIKDFEKYITSKNQ